MIIRKAQKKDIETIVAFQLQMAQETESLLLDAAILQQGVAAVFDDITKGQYYVVENQDIIIASVLITYEWSDWRNAVVWWIQSVYVLSEFRQKGVFSFMYHFLQSLVQQNETIAGLRLYVDHRNVNAQKVYQKMGMNGDHYQFFEWMKDEEN
ncbi:MAG: GNAT family N-acetyltransferase [Bacteroidales bacterium]|nr:GNAT family N-acetyltransferase [Bacteroidales bacterium]